MDTQILTNKSIAPSSTPGVEVGYVLSTRNFLATLDGLPSAKINDIIESEEGSIGLVSGILEDHVEALILDESHFYPGQMFKLTGKSLTIPVGEFLLGRAISPLGTPLDGKKPFAKTSHVQEMPLENTALGIEAREFITEQFVTGITLVDTLIPLGKGQRELVIGDPHSGKSSFLMNLIINQKEQDTICIYTSIGKPIINVRNLIDFFQSTDSLKNIVIVAASATEPTPLIYLAPQTGFTVAEYFQKLGKNVLLILDDIGNHAKIYREIALLSERSPGRESYPGDIFYQHAHLLERAGNYNQKFGGGSITALPVIEINLNDFTTFIPTNLMGMTDGHLMFRSSLSNQGQNPAIDINLSVSRVGRQTQNRLQNALSQKIRQVMAQADELETVKRFSSELPVETRILLHQKELIQELISQESLTFISLEIQIIMLSLIFTPYFNDKSLTFLKQNKQKLAQIFIKEPDLSPLAKTVAKVEKLEDFLKTMESIIPRLNQLLGERGKA
jgi:F-type H+/Na+-transporting ATPase subunit alpha